MSIASDVVATVELVVNTVVTASTLRNSSNVVPTIHKRKFPVVSTEDESVVIILTLGTEEYEPATGEDDFAFFVYYPVTVTIVLTTTTSGVLKESDLIRQLRESIKKKLLDFRRLTLSNTLPLDDIDAIATPRYLKPALKSGYDYIQLSVNVKTREGRT